jgi:REP element-mobilizing transposase RayT
LRRGSYHVTARGNERKDIFRDDTDRVHFKGLLGQAIERFGVVVHAWVLMSNHYHVLVEAPVANLSGAMQWLNLSYGVVQLPAPAGGPFVSGRL